MSHFSGHYIRFLCIVFAIFWIWAAYKPLYPHDWLLENVLVFFFVPVVILLGRYFRLSLLSYTLITCFMILHVIGSHYTYAEVPFGDTLQKVVEGDRNMYDRMVHFSFGLLLAYPIREVFMRIARTRGVWSFYFPVDLVLAFSGLYEVVEWLTAYFVSPAAGIAFLGAQGDVWDAQKDMALAGLGALIAMMVVFIVNWYFDKHFVRELRASLSIRKDDTPLGETRLRELLRKKR